MVTFDGIAGHRPVIEFLRQALEEDHLPQALLFQGPEGVGKATVARALAAAILCTRAPRKGCGSCPACLKVEHGNHPDFLTIGRQEKAQDRRDEDEPAFDGAAEEASDASLEPVALRSEVLVEQIRELIEHAVYSPREGERKLFLVDPADRMNLSAQNALLKTLEEPAGRAVLVLSASRPHRLLPTVRSRCTILRFAPLPQRELAAWLKERGVARDEAESRAARAEGCPGTALTIDLDTADRRRDAMLAVLERVVAAPKSLRDLSSHAKEIAAVDEDGFLDALSLLESLLRDAARAGLGIGGLMHPGRADALEALGRKLPPARAAALVRSIERIRADMRFHINRTIAAEAILAALAGGPLP